MRSSFLGGLGWGSSSGSRSNYILKTRFKFRLKYINNPTYLENIHIFLNIFTLLGLCVSAIYVWSRFVLVVRFQPFGSEEFHFYCDVFFVDQNFIVLVGFGIPSF